MANLPYVTSPGNIDRALNQIKQAALPDRVSQDFVKTILKIPGGSGTQITTFLKKIGFTGQDGAPSELYRKFRNPAQSGAAVATAIRTAYAPLYIRNEFMHEMPDDALLGLVTEVTGQAHDSNPVKLIYTCIKNLKGFANFASVVEPIVEKSALELSSKLNENQKPEQIAQSFGLNLGYTINLNLPATSDPEVFNAIFKSLKEHLLSSADA